MAELKTKPQGIQVSEYLNQLSEEKKQDAMKLIKMMEEITLQKAVVWGTSIIGFGQKRYRYASGREIDYFLLGFSARKQALTLYLNISTNQRDFHELGPHKKGVGCLYIKKLADIHMDVLSQILKESFLEATRA